MKIRKRRIEELGLGLRDPMRLGDLPIDVEEFFEGIRLFAEGPMRGVMRFERQGAKVSATMTVDAEFTAAIFKEAIIAAGDRGDILVAAASNDEGIKMYIAFSNGLPKFETLAKLGRLAHYAGYNYYGTTETAFYMEAKIRHKKTYNLYNPTDNRYYRVLNRIFFDPALPPEKPEPIDFT